MILTKQGWSTISALLLAIIFTLAAFWNTDPEVYLFPRITASLMLLLASIQFLNFLMEQRSQTSKSDDSTNIFNWRALLPGILVGIIYVLIMEQLGFYISAYIAFVIITSLYGKRRTLDPKALAYKAFIGFVFITILYCLFWKLLNVRTPTGLFF